jgi:hypothetical protein
MTAGAKDKASESFRKLIKVIPVILEIRLREDSIQMEGVPNYDFSE